MGEKDFHEDERKNREQFCECFCFYRSLYLLSTSSIT